MTKDEAIKKALTFLNKKEWEACDYILNANQAADILEEALAQPEQEPVAWWIPKHKAPDMVSKVRWSDECEPLYTTPPQRKPLSDEEIDKAWRSCDYTVPWEQHRIDIARAIEAAHGIKGEA